MKIRIVFFITFFIFLAQSNYAVSKNSKELDILFDKIDELWRIDLDSAKTLSLRALNISKRSGDYKNRLRALEKLSKCYFRLSKIDSVGIVVSKYLHLSDSLDNKLHQAKALKIYGGMYYSELGQFGLAIRDLYKAISIFDSLGDMEEKSDALLYLSSNYFLLNEIEQGKKILNESLNIENLKKDSVDLMIPMIKMADIFLFEKKYDSALTMYYKVLRVASKNNNAFFKSSMNSAICQIYDLKAEYSKAIFYCKRSLEHKAIDFIGSHQHIITLLIMAKVYAHVKVLDSAIAYNMKGLEVIEQYGMGKFYPAVYDNLSDHHAQMGNYEQSNKYLKLWMTHKDSIAKQAKMNKISNLEKKYEFEKKEQEIENLKLEAQLKEANNKQAIGLSILLATILLTIAITITIRFRLAKARSEKKLLQIEQRLFRAQINPHFLYNALSAIQGVIFENKPLVAGNYISDFSSLMRMILENSSREFTSLDQELRLLELYIDLQLLRFEEKFRYSIECDPNLKLDQIEFPSMILQPYVENAIEHGLREKSQEGIVIIRLKKNNNSLVVEIEDNGIGFDYKEWSVKERPRGMQLVKDRLSHLKKLRGINNKLEVLNLAESNREKSGTLIRLTFINYLL